MTKTATTAQVRSYFKSIDAEVRISKDGHVVYRYVDLGEQGPWLEGRWVSEYRVTDDGQVHHT